MSQVLINLIRNAAQAARAHHDSPHVWLRFARASGGRAQITVEDNGPGVPEGLRRDIFLPFFTTRSEGTGVGLSLARQVVLAHRGSITVGDSPEGGAMFRIVI
jgi:signal transduction histidine kinase